MVDLAKECGVDMVKFQAGRAEDFARRKKDIKKYKKYELHEGYKRLLFHGNSIGIPVFFSIWSREYEWLWEFEPYHKLAARQFSSRNIMMYDTPNTFISIPYRTRKIQNYNITDSMPLHCVSRYPAEKPHLEYIPLLRKYLKRDVGYSDHTIGINACVKAVKEYGAVVIEKHFTFAHDFGQLRDHRLSATPEEMREMVRKLKGE